MNKSYILYLLLIVFLYSCSEKNWDEHYQTDEVTVNGNLWDSIKSIDKFTEFVKYIEQFGLDSIIDSPNPTTLFIPNNEAFDQYLSGDTTGLHETMMYHIINGLFPIRSVENQYRLQTYSEKFALIENRNNLYYFDDIEIIYFSPLYRNGKFYELSEVVLPKLSLYEYIKYNNPAFSRYISTQDSIVLDREESEPLGYDEFGRTIYDSVTYIYNIFEEDYFKISKESRSLTATLVIPSRESYEAALDEMSDKLNSSVITNHEDIPVDWQNEILIPGLLHKGVYGGTLEPEFFNQTKFTNVRGDSIFRDFEIDPGSRIICSNGIIYHYNSFSVNDSLYLLKKVEGESLVRQLGINRYSWIEEITDVSCDNCVQPIEQEVTSASNDSVIDVSFPSNYSGIYTVSFYMNYVFPGTYRGEWRSNYITSGVYNVYVNDELIVEGFDTRSLIDGVFSVDPNLYKLWPDDKGFNAFDFWVEVMEYGSVKFTLEYTGPGNSTNNGLVMDYVGLFPKSN